MHSSEYTSAALRLISHARYCCNQLADGTPGISYRDPRYWTTKLTISPEQWIHPIITPDVLELCSALGIDVAAIAAAKTSLEQLCRLLNAVDHAASPILSDVPTRPAGIEVHATLDPAAYRNTRLSAIPDVFAPFTSSLDDSLDIYLHGSSADLQITPFSDVDDLVVIRRNTWQTVEQLGRAARLLAAAARRFQDVDRLQHHGHWVVTDLCLEAFDQSFIPTVVLEDAVRVCGRERLDLRVLNEPDLGQGLAISKSSIDRLLSVHRRGNGMRAFDLKCLAGEAMLLPAKVFQYRGEMLSKPAAIARAAEVFSPDAMAALEWATMVRREFGRLVHRKLPPLVEVRLRYLCPRRIHAQRLMRGASAWVGSDHPLGVTPAIERAYGKMSDEAHQLIRGD
jgi:predicted nucleotidyltransferase